MENGGLKADIVIYSTVIDNMCKSNNVDEAKKLFDSHPSKNLKCNTVIFTIMIIRLLTEGLLQESEDLFARMLDKGPTPNELTYNTMFQGLLQNNKLDKAVPLRNEMVVADHTESSTMSVNLVYLCFDNFSSIGAPKGSLGFGVASSALGLGRRLIAEADVPVLSLIGVDSVKQGDVDTEGLGS
ncbi:hypothetical protein GIB67_019364 [Kingdonia uniflora]|uniref:Pentatricopeptide repeat-containing protein n=1 Tax=Kingdonia uniflora TaxID=39325 RepID=A0A7J7M1K9_9MAGN|nr:hypothetical protein GIB67_019364 [Kingdonia uniflora]